MKKTDFLSADKISFAAGAALLAALTGCVAEPSTQRTAYRGRPAVQVQSSISYQDDYDYFPGYEVYYSRHRREYVYRDGNAWVRRPEPRGVTVSALFASASVRMEFQDSPEQHHGSVVRSYPRNWMPPGTNRDHQATTERASLSGGFRVQPAVQAQTAVTGGEAYEYYPAYETYYNRNRREYVYRDGNAWVHRPAPRAVTVAALTASPSVRLEFQGPPEQHHGSVVKSYPKNWKKPDRKHDDKDERKDDRRDDKQDNDRRN